ncbi:hypothetical protein HEQ60_05980 [Haematospirillum sp. H1815]|uniref:hypothetical protein n=1 Tax=Haematospirillum sp. H1815 TaxID=2723108 RepID=UPI001439E8F0|nr:hypothetical protein [Haematospirillum sp. H1815]NKD77308.1 hypothetical protein [Haematospirillum sp. H1815]
MFSRLVCRGLVVSFGVVLLAGCASNTDPAQGGFLSGVRHLASGGYEERVKERQEALENEQDLNTQKKREYDRTQQEQASVAEDRAAAEKRYAQLEKELRTLKGRLEKAKGRNNDLKAEIASLEAKIAQLRSDPVTPVPEKKRRLDALQRQKEDLNRQVDRALGQ